jgi:hypothetical protein
VASKVAVDSLNLAAMLRQSRAAARVAELSYPAWKADGDIPHAVFDNHQAQVLDAIVTVVLRCVKWRREST